MKCNLENTRIFIRTGSTDLRKASSGLSAIVVEEMELDIYADSIFLFCNKSKQLIKCLKWDKTGFWLAQKRLEKAKWPWPMSEKAVSEINEEQLKLFLHGIDFWKAHTELKYKSIT